MATSGDKVGIIGCGIVGKQWAMIFASVGYKVVLFDIDEKQVSKALSDISANLKKFEEEGTLRGDVNAQQQSQFISGTNKLEECVKVFNYLFS